MGLVGLDVEGEGHVGAGGGDVDVAALKPVVDKAFGDWRQPAAGPLPYARVDRPLVQVKADRFIVVTPDKQNANLRTQLALPLNDTAAEYPAAVMANYLFGLSQSSRLWTRIREKEGLSYDVRSVVDWNTIEPNSMW